MKKSKKIVAVFIATMLFIQIFCVSGTVFASTAPATVSDRQQQSATDSNISNSPKDSSVVSNPVKDVKDAVVNPTALTAATASDKQSESTLIGKITESVKKESKKNNIIVKYKDINKAGNSRNKYSSKKPASKVALKKSIKRFNMETLEISSDEDVANILNDLKSDSNVEYAQLDYELESFLTPSDPRYNEQWGLLNNGQAINGQAGAVGVDIGAEKAWDITTGSNDVIVGILDTGLDPNNSEISNNVYINTKELPNGIDDDLDGMIDNINGYDFYNRDGSVFDDSLKDVHAMHIAGIIAAKHDNNGIAGVAPNVKILPLKFINGNVGRTSDAIDAISYGISVGVKIFNCSWGGSQENPALKDIISSSDAIFLCAAGNAGQNLDTNPTYPACYQLPNVISVAALDNNGEIAAFSNFGSKAQICAPGVNILSTLPGNKYGFMSGTSMSTPFVTGVAALLKSKYTDMTASEIKARILNNATYEQNLAGKVSTSGMLNAEAALLNSPSGTVRPSAEPTPEVTNKPKDPELVYDTSASGNNKTVKPIVEDNNLFVDAVNFTTNSPDSYEPNDSRQTAISISNDTAIYPTLHTNIDEDWFVLDTTKTGKLNVTMKSLPLDCDYDLAIYDSTGAYVGGSYAGVGLDEKYAGLINTAGKYYIRVYYYSGSNLDDTYELKAGVYTPDDYEMNDDLYSILNSQPSISIWNSTFYYL